MCVCRPSRARGPVARNRSIHNAQLKSVAFETPGHPLKDSTDSAGGMAEADPHTRFCVPLLH